MLSFALLAALTQGADGPSLRVLAGRVVLARPEGIERRTTEDKLTWLDARGYLESSATSRFEMSWDGAASLECSGPTTIEWREATSERGGVYLDLLRVERLHLEVRRGPLRCVLPGGWIFNLEHGASFLRRLPDGHFELEHGAGAPLLVAREARSGDVRPPWTVLPGAKVRLEADALAGHRRVLAPPQAMARAKDPMPSPSTPWASFRWPWDDPTWAPLTIEVPTGAAAVRWGTPDPTPFGWIGTSDTTPTAPVVGSETVPPTDANPAALSDATPEPQNTADAATTPAKGERALRMTPWGPRWSRRR